MYQKEMKAVSQRDIYTPMFLAALSTIAKVGNNLMFIDKMNGYAKCGIHISGTIFKLKNGIHNVCYNMDEP